MVNRSVIKKIAGAALGALVLSTPLSLQAAEGESLVTFKVMSPDLAIELAQATLEACREKDFQVAVAVVDRFGIVQVILRDQLAGAHTPETARRKAWTAVSFRTDTLSLGESTKAGNEASGIRFVTDVLMAGGGTPVMAGGSLVGGVGVSGAPSGESDDECANEGIEQVSDQLDF